MLADENSDCTSVHFFRLLRAAEWNGNFASIVRKCSEVSLPCS